MCVWVSGSSEEGEDLLHSLVDIEDMRASREDSEMGAKASQRFGTKLPGGSGACPLRENRDHPVAVPIPEGSCSECIIRPSVITSLNLPRTLRLPPPNLPYKFILLKKLKMSVFCERCINELSPRMTEGEEEEEAREDIPHFECLHVSTLSLARQQAQRGCFLCRKRARPPGSKQPAWAL